MIIPKLVWRNYRRISLYGTWDLFEQDSFNES